MTESKKKVAAPKKGQTVVWKGRDRVYRGVVLALIRAGDAPPARFLNREKYDLSALRSIKTSRPATSFLIQIEGDPRPKLYWPDPKLLTVVNQE